MDIELILWLLGGGLFLSLMAYLTAYYKFPPNLTIEDVKDKNKYNIESSIIVKNIGNLPAYNIVVDYENLNYVNDLGGSVSNGNFSSFGSPISKISSDESTEISVVVNINFFEAMSPGRSLKSCSYILILKYEFKLPLIKPIKKTKEWYIELRNFEDGFHWRANLK